MESAGAPFAPEVKPRKPSQVIKESHPEPPVSPLSPPRPTPELVHKLQEGHPSPHHPIAIDQAPIEKPFDPKEHERFLREEVITLLQGKPMQEFFQQLHGDDFDALTTILRKATGGLALEQQIALPKIILNGLLKDTSDNANLATARTILTSLPSSDQTHSTEELQQMLQVLGPAFYQSVDQNFPPENILGMQIVEGLTKEDINKRYAEIVHADRSMQLTLKDFERVILDRARLQLLAKVEALQAEKARPVEPVAVPTIENIPTEEPTIWQALDREKEATFQELTARLENLSQDEARQIILDTFNPLLEQDGISPFSLEDLQNLYLMFGQSASASEIAGQPIVRPVFAFTEYDAFKRFYARLFPDKQPPGAVLWEGEAFVNSPFAKTGLVMGLANPDFLGHELRHTIDPHRNRAGYNRILAEAFAYYHQVVVGQDPNSTRKWETMKQLLGKEHYYNEYTPQEANKLPHEGYQQLVNQVIDTINELRVRLEYNDIAVQHIIAECQTLEEFFGRAKQHTSP